MGIPVNMGWRLGTSGPKTAPAHEKSGEPAPSSLDECGVGLGNLHRLRELAKFLTSEQWLNSLPAFLCQPTRQTGRVLPHVRHGVVADHRGYSILDTLSLRVNVTDQ